MKARIIPFLLCLLVLAGCAAERQNDENAGEDEVLEAYQAVLLGESQFFSADEGEYRYLSEFDYWINERLGTPLTVTQFAVIDLDGDDILELVLELTTGYDGSIEVLHYEDGVVYGFAFPYRGFLNLRRDGTFTFSNGAADNGVGRLAFSEGACDFHTLCESVSQDNAFYIGGETVSEEDFYGYFAEQNSKPLAQWYPFTEANAGRLSDMVSETQEGADRTDDAWSGDFEDELQGYSQYKYLVADALGYDSSAVSHIRTLQAEIALLASGAEATVITFAALFYNSPIYNTPVMVIDTGVEILCEILTEGAYSTKFSLADVDGDDFDEILTQNDTGGNGGAGTYLTAIYKLKNGAINKLFCYPDYGSYFDTGFTLTLSDGWVHTVENEYTGFTFSFVRETKSSDPYFNEDGSTTEYSEESNCLGVDPYFFTFDPMDIDGDGIFEIMTAQYTYLWGRSDSVGAAYTILKWNDTSRSMDIVKAGFWPYEEYDDSNMEEYAARWQDYEDNWYKD